MLTLFNLLPEQLPFPCAVPFIRQALRHALQTSECCSRRLKLCMERLPQPKPLLLLTC